MVLKIKFSKNDKYMIYITFIINTNQKDKVFFNQYRPEQSNQTGIIIE